MCELVFEVQGKTENYVRLKKDGHGIKFLGNNFYLITYIKKRNNGTTYMLIIIDHKLPLMTIYF